MDNSFKRTEIVGPNPGSISTTSAIEERSAHMGFSGMRAVILIAVLIGLVLAVTKLGLPGWILPVGLIFTAGLLRAAEKKASA